MFFFLFFHMAPHKSGVSEWRTCFQQNVDFNLWSKIVPPTYVSICMYLALFIFQFLEQCFKIKRIKGLTALWINDRDLLPIISIFRKVHSARPPALSGCTSYFLPRKLSTSQRSKCQIVMAFTISLSLVLRTNQDRLVVGYNFLGKDLSIRFLTGIVTIH